MNALRGLASTTPRHCSQAPQSRTLTLYHLISGTPAVGSLASLPDVLQRVILEHTFLITEWGTAFSYAARWA